MGVIRGFNALDPSVKPGLLPVTDARAFKHKLAELASPEQVVGKLEQIQTDPHAFAAPSMDM